jgi:DNA-binding XRE family transcriptional regulator
MEQQTMGGRIAALRKEKGMTQLELARRMNVTDKAVSKWERDKAAPDVYSLPRLAELLGVTPDTLLTAVPAPPPAKNAGEAHVIVALILRAIPLAMGVAVVVLAILTELDLPTAATLLGIGMACLSVYLLERKEG